MNRMRESEGLSEATKWRLAAAYAVAGQPEAAVDLTRDLATTVKPYTELSGTFGSALRDEAMILETLCLMGRMTDAERLVGKIQGKLGSSIWYGTQSIAYALIAVARYAGLSGPAPLLDVTYQWEGGENQVLGARQAVAEASIDPALLGESGVLAVRNNGRQTLYGRDLGHRKPRARAGDTGGRGPGPRGALPHHGKESRWTWTASSRGPI